MYCFERRTLDNARQGRNYGRQECSRRQPPEIGCESNRQVKWKVIHQRVLPRWPNNQLLFPVDCIASDLNICLARKGYSEYSKERVAKRLSTLRGPPLSNILEKIPTCC